MDLLPPVIPVDALAKWLPEIFPEGIGNRTYLIREGLRMDYGRNLPDIILADIFIEAPKVVFIELVVTDGAMTEARKQSLLRVTSEAGFSHADVYFVSAFADRNAPGFRKSVAEIAWGTFAWFSSEPDNLLAFRTGRPETLCQLFSQSE